LIGIPAAVAGCVYEGDEFMVSDRRDGTVAEGVTTEGLPVAPSLGVTMEQMHIPARPSLMDARAIRIVGLAILLGVAAGFIAEILRRLIGLVTNVAFFGRISTENVLPAEAVPHLGAWVIAIPVIGAIVVGLMARYGSRAIRGHGIPEAMEQVLTNESRIPPRITWLKPLSAAIAIGTGGPFGAEGPIIATGGALGSFIGQLLRTTSAERKTLLAAGAAAGMAATFGSPVSAVLLAVELLLFEFRPRSLVPVALAAAAATGVHFAIEGAKPVFDMPALGMPTAGALVAYVLIGAIIGAIATLITRAVYWVEDAFELLEHWHIHWMWWPAIGAIAVGIIGLFVPLTLGVGYSNIAGMLAARWGLAFVAVLVGAKFLSWVIALGSGTSGGTLAPLFTMGGGLGLLLGAAANAFAPGAGIDIHVAALVGMAAIFAGATRALLASIVFAFETTLQPMGLLPLLGGCTTSYLVSCILMRNTIMTEKIVRRGVRVPVEYASDFLDQVTVKDMASSQVVVLAAEKPLAEARAFVTSGAGGSSHQGFPVVNRNGAVVGVLTRRDLLGSGGDDVPLEKLLRRPPVVVHDDCSLREAADHMVNHDVGRLPVISREGGQLVGIITRSDLLKAHRRRIRETHEPAAPTVRLPFMPAIQSERRNSAALSQR
jgi:H+/Cl- antiporter ClcA/CBS domain-containing protein